jgi:signal transduction histidine kinase/ActR/RegA family two-component response regulator
MRSRFPIVSTCFVYLFLVFISPSVQAVGQQQSPWPLQGLILPLEVLKDENHTLTIQQVASPAFAKQFRRPVPDNANYGMSKAAYWFRLTVPPSGQPQMLQILNPLLENVSLYLARDSSNRTFQVQRSGNAIDFEQRAVPYHYPVFRLPVSTASPLTCYVHVRSSGPILIPVQIFTEAEFISNDHQEQFWQGIFYGIMLVMAAYNFILYLFLKDRSYLLYVLYLVSATVFQLALSGLGDELLWDAPTWWSVRSTPISGIVTAILVVAFCLEFLHVKRQHPAWYWAGVGFIAIASVKLLVITVVANTGVSFVLLVTTAGLFVIVIMGISIRMMMARNRSAIYLLIAWVILLTSIVSAVLSSLGLVFGHAPVIRFLQVGLCADVILLSLALVDRINNIRIQTAQVEQQKDIAERNQKIKEEVLATMSHEMRTPLNAVIGFAKLLEKGKLTQTQSGYVRHIRESADNLLMLINDILDLSKINAGKVTFEQVEIDLEHGIDVLFQTIQFQVAAKNLEVVRDIQPEVPRRFLGDPIRLNQILLNLLSNAVKFTHEGRVTLRIQLHQSDNQTVTLLFEVEDTGIGIPSTKLSSIFEGFTQASYDTTRVYGGTGLGLAITKQLVEMQGGTLRVRSTVNVGSTFSVTLPFYKIYDATAVSGDASGGGANSQDTIFPLHVLIIEDNPLNQIIARSTLENAEPPATVDVASTGKEGIDLFSATDYHAVLIDLQMPDMDGPEVARYIRLHFPEKKGTPLIAMTASLDEREHAEALAAGMNAVVTKPFDAGKLFEKIIKLRPDLRNSTAGSNEN